MKRAQTMDEWKEQMAEYISRRDAAMIEAGVKAGDQVEYHAVSPFGSVEVMTGTLYIASNGQPKVKIGRTSRPWHKGWRIA